MQISILASGSTGNSLYVKAGDTELLVDVGMSTKYVCQQLEKLKVEPQNIKGILLTHEHSDHIGGVRVFNKKFSTPVFANHRTWLAGRKHLDAVPSDSRAYFATYQPFTLGEVTVTPFGISHDAAEPVGFSIEAEGKKIVVATDLGIITLGVYAHCWDADVLVIESNHDTKMLDTGPYPVFLRRRVASKLGHLANELTAQFCSRIITRRTKKVFLAHLSQTNNSPKVAYDTISHALRSRDIHIGSDIDVLVAPPKNHTPLVVF